MTQRKLQFLVAACALSVVLTAGAGASHNLPADELPAVVKAVAPSFYPPIAKAARAEGKVIVEVRVNTSGEVTAAKWVEGHKLLYATSEIAAKRWKFAPSQSNSGERTVRLTFTFHLGDDDVDTVSFVPPYEVEFIGRVARIS